MNAKKIFLILGLAASLVTTPTLNAGFMPKMIEENPRMTAAITSGTAALLAGSMILAPKTRAKIQRALNRMIKRGGPAASASDIALATATIMAAIGAAGLGGYSVMGRKKAAPAQEQANPLDDIQRAGVASTVTTPESDNPAEAPEIAAKKAHAAREIQRRFRGYKERIAAERAESARIAAEEARKKLITDAFRLNQKKATPPHDSATPSPTEWVELTATEFQALALLTKQLDATEGVGANRIASMLKRNKITKAESTDHVLIEKVSFDTLKQMIQKNTARIAAEEAEATRIAAEEAQAAREIQRIVRGKIGRRTAEEAHAARIAAEEAHAARIAAEEAEATRIAAQEAEAARIAAQEAEAARIAAEEADPARAAKEAEAGRIAAEEAEAARVAAEEAEATRKADAAFNYTTPDSYALSGSKSNTH